MGVVMAAARRQQQQRIYTQHATASVTAMPSPGAHSAMARCFAVDRVASLVRDWTERKAAIPVQQERICAFGPPKRAYLLSLHKADTPSVLRTEIAARARRAERAASLRFNGRHRGRRAVRTPADQAGVRGARRDTPRKGVCLLTRHARPAPPRSRPRPRVRHFRTSYWRSD